MFVPYGICSVFLPKLGILLQDFEFSMDFVYMCISMRGSAYTLQIGEERIASKSAVLLHLSGLKRNHESVER